MSKKKTRIDRSAVFQAILGDLNDSSAEPFEASSESVEDARQAVENLPTHSTGEINLDLIDFNLNQPRKNFAEQGLEELAASIKEHGILEPILVRPLGDRYEVIAGERRSRAARIAGLNTIPTRVLNVTEQQAFEISIVENLQRQDLNPVEETEAVLHLTASILNVDPPLAITLLQEVYNRERGRRYSLVSEVQYETIQDIFKRLGRFTVSSFVANRIPILSFPEELKDAVRNGHLEFTKAQLLARIEDAASRHALTALAIREGLSISQIRRRIAESNKSDSGQTSPQSGIFTTSEQAPQLLKHVKKHLTIQTVSQMDGQRQAEVARILAQLNELLTRG